MGRVNDLIVEINDLLSTDLSDKEIAETVECPIEWVSHERELLALTFHSITNDDPTE